MVVPAGQAIRGVALGVVVTALVQSTLGGIGLVIAGVPFAGVLTAIMFALCIAQTRADPGAAGSHRSGHTSTFGIGWGIFLLVWSLVVGLMDNFLRPVLIRRGADLPLLLIFAGVVGGLVAFGIVGIFVGPVLLAVAYTLLDDWVSSDPVAIAGDPGVKCSPLRGQEFARFQYQGGPNMVLKENSVSRMLARAAGVALLSGSAVATTRRPRRTSPSKSTALRRSTRSTISDA